MGHALSGAPGHANDPTEPNLLGYTIRQVSTMSIGHAEVAEKLRGRGHGKSEEQVV